MRTVEEMVTGILKWEEESPEVAWTVEQPEGSSLAQDPAMRRLKVRPVKAHMCTYNGEKWCKPTLIWTRLLA